MAFALDASIALDWALQERHPTAEAVRERLQGDAALAPALWWFEVRNGLLIAERRGRADEAYSAAFLRQLAGLPISLDDAPVEANLLAVARKHRLTVYDAAYLELALRRAVPLATLDQALVRAARAEGVSVIGDLPE